MFRNVNTVPTYYLCQFMYRKKVVTRNTTNHFTIERVCPYIELS